MKKRTDEEFKNIMADMFGKEYICEETKYVNNATPVILLCPKHGLFKRIPTDLTKGKGCQKCSYEKLSKERTRWNKNGAIEISKKYPNRSSFKKGDYSAYKLCLKNGWFDEMPWMLPQDKWNKNNYVYAYIDEKNKVAYVGLTCNKQEREWSHQHKSNSSVYKYFTSIDCDIPRPIYLEENLSKVDAQIKEDEWRTIFIKRGYIMLNIGKTGKGVGSIGGNLKKWSKNKVFEESKKYKTRIEFKKSCSGAYNVAFKNKWLDEMTWLIPLRLNTKNITREEVFIKAKEFMYKSHFRKNANTYFRIAEKNDWLKEMTWFKKPNRIYQTKESEGNMKKLTFEEVMDRYEKLVNDEYEFPSFSSYYVTDNGCDGTKEKPYKLKCLWFVPIDLQTKKENNKYILSEEQKTKFKNILIETFNKENIYLF